MLTVKVETQRLEKALDLAAQYSSRTKTELVNQTTYYVAKGALYHTYAPDKAKIRASLQKTSNKSPSASVANIMVNVKRAKQGKVGLNGAKMTIATETFIKVQESHRTFAKSGFVQSARALAPFVKNKGGAAKSPAGVRVKISNSGGAIPARVNKGQVTARFWNSINGKDNQSTVQKYQEEGLAKAIHEEATDKFEHVAQKQMEAGFISIFK